MSEVERYWIDPSRLVQKGWHQDDTCVVKDWAYDRVTAERDAALGREKECQRQLGERWKDIEALQSSLDSADASSQTLHEVIARIRSERDALQVLLTAADERDDQRKELLQMFIDNSGDKDVVELCMHALNTAEVDGDEAI